MDSNLTYREVLEKLAYSMFHAMVKLRYEESVCYFVGTLFVVNFSFALNKLSSDGRNIFAKTLLKKFSLKELYVIKESILLRKDDASFDTYFENGLSNAIITFEKELDKTINDLKNNQ